MRKIESYTADRCLKRELIPECLLVPVAAVNQGAIKDYVGDVIKIIRPGSPNNALLVSVDEPSNIDRNLRIWGVPKSDVLFKQHQVWVHVDYRWYRKAYKRALPDENIDGLVLSHTISKLLAKLLGYEYVRLLPTTRQANSSSILSEKMGWEMYSTQPGLKEYLAARPSVAYADTTELLLMLNLMIGGGLMESAYYADALFMPRGSALPRGVFTGKVPDWFKVLLQRENVTPIRGNPNIRAKNEK